MAVRPVRHIHRPGRKKRPGTYVVDGDRGRLGIFLEYCENCGNKVIMDRDTLSELMSFMRKDEDTRGYKLLRFLLGRRTL